MSELHNKELRQVYTDSLIKLSKRNKNIVVLEADLMNCIGTAKFKAEYPKRFINCGIAEANMIGIAAGLASCGKIPFASSFTPFATRRCFDQIAVSVGYSKQNVKIVGTDPGIMAQNNGGTHMSFEDVALMSQVPGMVVFEPVDAVMLDKAMPEIVKSEQPFYIRLQRKKAPAIIEDNFKFDLFKAIELTKGKDITIIACSIMVHRALSVAKRLLDEGISANVISIHTYKPLDTETIIKAVKNTGACVTCENHRLTGGLGSAIASTLMQEGVLVPFGMVGIADRYGEVGNEKYLAEVMGLTEQDIYNKVKCTLAKKTN